MAGSAMPSGAQASLGYLSRCVVGEVAGVTMDVTLHGPTIFLAGNLPADDPFPDWPYSCGQRRMFQ